MSQVIISLKPEYGKLVLSGSKTVELRKQDRQDRAGHKDLDIHHTSYWRDCSYSRLEFGSP